MTVPLAILAVAVIYGAASFAATQAVFDESDFGSPAPTASTSAAGIASATTAPGANAPGADAPEAIAPVATAPAPAAPSNLTREAVRMVLVLTSASVGALLQSRIDNVLEILTFGCVVAGLSAAVAAGIRPPMRTSAVTFYLGIAALALVVFATIVGGDWRPFVPGLLCAAPFAIAGYFYPRASSTDDAMYAGLAGSVLSLMPGMFVLTTSCLVSIAIARVRAVPAAQVRFFPFVAGFLLVGLFVQFALIDS